MRYRQLGTSGLWISEIAAGVAANVAPHVDPATVRACLHAAADAGVTTFHATGGPAAVEAAAAGLDGLARDELVLCGELSWPREPGPGGAGLGRREVRTAVAALLRTLRTDRLDVLFLPAVDPRVPLEEVFATLADLCRAGALHHVGVTEWPADHLARGAAIAARHGLALVASRVHYSLMWRVCESQVAPAAEHDGIGLIGYAPLVGGLLTGKYTDGAPAGSRGARAGSSGGLLRALRTPDLLDRVDRVRGVADAAGLTPAQLALAWALQHRAVAGLVVGATDPLQVKENCGAAGHRLDLDVLVQLDELLGGAVQTDPRLTLALSTS